MCTTLSFFRMRGTGLHGLLLRPLTTEKENNKPKGKTDITNRNSAVLKMAFKKYSVREAQDYCKEERKLAFDGLANGKCHKRSILN